MVWNTQIAGSGSECVRVYVCVCACVWEGGGEEIYLSTVLY